jgi:3-O-methylgallate 3,4-dioxygenase
MDHGFDVSQSKRLSKPHGEGHAFGFVHRRLMPRKVVPVVPIALNTYYPPNQPRPRRCYDLGRALAAPCAPGDGRIDSAWGFHFTVDEESTTP